MNDELNCLYFIVHRSYFIVSYAIVALSVSPQKMQYRSFASGYAPHFGQRRTVATSCTPQCMQNWSFASTGRRQLGQTVPCSAPVYGVLGTGGGLCGSGGGAGAASARANSSADA